MKILLVLAHPLEDSFAAAVARTIRATLETGDPSVDVLDLYREDFDPRLSPAERRSGFSDDYDASAVADLVERLKAADGLFLVFPQWWFNMPAILKGFFDRVFAPGVAYTADPAGGRIVPLLGNIRHFRAFTTTGSPWWVVTLYMGNPVKRILKRGIAKFCSPGVDFRMLNLADMDRNDDAKRQAHLKRVAASVSRF